MTVFPIPDLVNEGIITLLIIQIPSDIAALQFCDLMEKLVDSKHSTTVIQVLRNGNGNFFNCKLINNYITYVLSISNGKNIFMSNSLLILKLWLPTNKSWDY